MRGTTASTGSASTPLTSSSVLKYDRGIRAADQHQPDRQTGHHAAEIDHRAGSG